MKTRSKFYRKVFVFLFLTALTLGFGISASANSVSTTLTTTVPSHFAIDVTIVGNGSIIIDEIELTQSAQISMERHKAVRIRLLPEDNNHMDSVVSNGTCIVDKVNNDEILLPALENNTELKVTFAVNSTTPDTGDTSFPYIIYFSIIAIISLFAIILLTIKRVRYNK